MTATRALLIVRMLCGALLMYLGVVELQDMWGLRESYAAQAGWRDLPWIGSTEPLRLVLFMSLWQFFLGVFLFGGLLTRFLAPVAVAVAAFKLYALGWGAGGTTMAMGLAALVVALRGGGSGTMDKSLGAMQRRSIERQRIRDEERAARRAATTPVEQHNVD
jgi:uncharacterized membrane protein YphA (DoxX/SURF4 family)